MLRFTLMALCFAAPLTAEERRLNGAEIDALPPSIDVLGDHTRQTVFARGAAAYTDRGGDSYGSSAARGDQYCPQWPPANGWACYDVLVEGETLIWIGDSGHRTITTIKPKGISHA